MKNWKLSPGLCCAVALGGLSLVLSAGLAQAQTLAPSAAPATPAVAVPAAKGIQAQNIFEVKPEASADPPRGWLPAPANNWN